MRTSLVLRKFALLICLVTCSQAACAQEDAVAEAVAVAEPTEAVGDTPKIRPLTVAAGLVDETTLTGTLLDSTSIEIKTAFGVAEIPLSEVAGIRFPSTNDNSTTVVMLNGDSITGATNLKFINIETTWGSAKINGQNIATMLFVPGLRWESRDGLAGKRWTLTEASGMQVQPASATSSMQSPNGVPSRIQGSVPANQVAPRIIYGQ